MRTFLTYDAPTPAGRTSARTDTFHGRFTTLVPDQLVAQAVESETADRRYPALTISYGWSREPGGTRLTGEHDHLPLGGSAQDNELGRRRSLDKLAEGARRARHPIPPRVPASQGGLSSGGGTPEERTPGSGSSPYVP